MSWQDGILALAGVVGATVAMIHGVLIQKLLVQPLAGPIDVRMSAPVKRLIAPLLHFSTYNWFLGGLALIAVAAGFQPGAKVMTALLVGSSYLFGAVGNCWATGGRHPGWMLMAVALILIAVGLYAPV